MTIDLLLVGGDRDVSWTHGDVTRCADSPAALRDALTAWLARTHADAVLLWNPQLGNPDGAVARELVGHRGDVWHAGLALGTSGHPGLIDFVAPNWMLNRDPDPDREATSWRVAAGACLVRTSVFQQLGLPCREFETTTAAMLEWGHRAVIRGAMMRHVPRLLGARAGSIAPPTLADEVRFVAYRYGRFWTRWVIARATLTGYASAPALLRALQEIPAERPYVEPPPYRTARKAGEPDLANARVTVLIPTIDRYPYLHVVLENLRTQTVKPFEIIIIDQTAKEKRDHTIAEKFADLPLRLMYQDEPGQCVSRNAGLVVSTGEYILFIDDDDELEPNVIEDHLRNLHAFDADVSSGWAQEVGTAPLATELQFVRASDVFPTNNTLIRRDVLRGSGLFDLAFNRAPRADGELGMRVYLSGAFMVLDQAISVLHHHAPAGGLRTHRARVVTYRISREQLTKRSLPHTSEIYLLSRHYSARQQREALWLRTFGTLSARGGAGRRLAKALIGSVQLPDTLKELRQRKRQSIEWLTRFPQIASLDEK